MKCYITDAVNHILSHYFSSNKTMTYSTRESAKNDRENIGMF